MNTIRGSRAHLRAYVGACTIAASAVLAIAFATSGTISWPTVAGFALLSLITETAAVTTALGSSYSVTFVVTVAAVIVVGPAGAIVATLFAAASLRDLRSRSPIRHLFNAAQLTLSSGLAAFAFHALAPGGRTLAWALPAALLAAAAHFLTNTFLVSGAIALSSERRVLEVWRSQFASLGRSYAAYAVLGVLLAVLHREVGWGSVLFLLVPLLVARAAFQTAITLQDAFDRVVTTLVAAVEQKDAYTGSHAVRVATLAERVARCSGMTAIEARAVRYAALMHDIGKLAVHNVVLQKSGKLTTEEYIHMQQHPEHGVALVRDVELLRPVLDGIRHHHERWDGTGYPDRLAGEAIPVAARVITVADAFDAMTSTRSYRRAMRIEEAFAELQRCAGSQFDPAAVAALERAIAIHGWEPVPEQIRMPEAPPQALALPPPVQLAHEEPARARR